ncbi:MAG: hypothetical protein HZA04_02685 [Nitrospinae bacterium]|nr:hypothetical protein [Nitrospinota bacterium]
MMSRKALPLALFLVLGTVINAHAEKPSPKVDIEYRYTAPQPAAKPVAGEEGVKLGYSSYSIKASVPAPFEVINNGYSMYGFRYSYLDVLNSGWQGGKPDFIGPLQSFTFDANFIKPLDGGARLMVMANLGYHGEASDWGFDAIRLQGGAMYETVPQDGGQWGLGLFYVSDFGYPIPLPFVTYRKKWENYRIDAAIPTRLAFWRLFPGEKLEAGLGYSVRGNQYHVNEGTTLAANKIKQTSLYAGPAVRWTPVEWATVAVDAGTTLYNKFEAWHGDTLVKDLTPQTGWYMAIGLSGKY